MTEQIIYADYAASTPIDARVAAVMLPWLTEYACCGNPSSGHGFGQSARIAIAQAREQIAQLLNAEPDEIIFTSGATEANNIAMQGVLKKAPGTKRHLITTQIEHPTVLKVCEMLEKEGVRVTYLAPQANGQITLEQVARAICNDTCLISVQHVNNETGVIQQCAEIGQLARQLNILFHIDAAQSVGKLIVNVKNLHVDFLTCSAHKMYGPKGVGALYVRHGIRNRMKPLFFGGAQEQQLRPGTLATHQIVGFGEAARILQLELAQDQIHALRLRHEFNQLFYTLAGVYCNSDPLHSVPHIINFTISGVEGEALLQRLAKRIALSSGSACTASNLNPSPVLLAMGLSPELAHSSLRLSIGRMSTLPEMTQANLAIQSAVSELRVLSPLIEGESWQEGIYVS